WKYRASTQTSTQINGQSHAGHKDLAAIPQDKAILDMGWPNLTIYKPHFTFPHGTHGAAQKPGAHCHSNLHPPTISITLEVWAERWFPGTNSQILAPRTSLYHFHHPKTTCPDSNIYKKLLIYKQREFMGGRPQSKAFIEEPSLSHPSSLYPSLLTPTRWPRSKLTTGLPPMTLHWRQMKRRKRRAMVTPEKKWHSRKHQREKLSKVMSKLGKMVLKEEMEKITLSLLYFSDFSPWGVRMEAHTLLICPYEMLVATSKGQTKLPPGLTGICQPRTSQ
ncbi:hypothetical protein EI555_006524, partial [Monodon monoceros]